MEYFKHPRDNGERIRWPLGKPPDRPAMPTDPGILAVLNEFRFSVKLGESCYEIINSKGDALQLPFGSLLNAWREACEILEAARGR